MKKHAAAVGGGGIVEMQDRKSGMRGSTLYHAAVPLGNKPFGDFLDETAAGVVTRNLKS